ncbi:MAG: glycoside hydrolase/phage tail family protein [Pseudomonadota bacterium]
MAQLLLAGASAVGSAVGGGGLGAIVAKTAASTAASFAAGYVDRLIFGPNKRRIEGPRIDSFTLQASTEGAGVLRVYGRARVAGQLIWAANFRETTSETTERAGKGGRTSSSTTYTEYLYSLSFAVGLCEGVIDRVGRVWADGKPLDLSGVTMRVYRGQETQSPDTLIESIEGDAPAFRGLAYVVFEDLPLKDFGNRIPQLAFEVERRLGDDDPGALENAVNAVTIIPGTGEFAYGTTRVSRLGGEGVTLSENAHNNDATTNFTASLDAARASLPNLARASLVVSWFGDDLRLGQCTLRPGVDAAVKETEPYAWSVGDDARTTARLVSAVDGAPAFGGTPADRAVFEAIAAMKAAGLKVTFHPFILMDVPPGNALPDPYGGAAQAAFPWRGRITVGADDKTAAAASALSAFFGTAAPGDFTVSGQTVSYTGPNERSFRRMILHYAHLCAAAGGVEAFLLGSELRGLTTARSAAGVYPAVAALKALAADVRAILGAGTEISYGADWSEYFGHQPADGSGDVYFHLDDFWADPAVDFIGVDNYVPLAEWRDGAAHADAGAAGGQHDLSYLNANVEGGEGFDWFYADVADRDAQTRTPITDGAYGEPWIYRYKDFHSWWSNAHHNRPGGVRSATPTAWVPQSKPIVFTETGCPAVDKGANQPNVFYDAKSAESALPYYSNGARDDLAQRRYIEALYAHWRDPANNPTSSLYAGRMIDTDRFFVYAWDARPFPFFPARGDVWSDGENWTRGHWLNGRAGRAPLDRLVAALAAPAAVDAGTLEGVLTGYVIDRPMAPREAIDPLASVFQFDAVETGATIRFQSRGAEPVLILTTADLAAGADDAPAFRVSTRDAADAPTAFRLGFVDEAADYAPGVVEARAPDAAADAVREAGAEVAAVMPPEEAAARARSVLADARVMRETARFDLDPTRLAVEPGDALAVTLGGVARRYRVSDIEDGPVRRIEAVRVEPAVYEAPVGPTQFRAPALAPVYGKPVFWVMDLPLFAGADETADPAAPYVAAFAEPWPGALALYRAAAGGTQSLVGGVSARAAMGRLETALLAGASGRRDFRSVRIRLFYGVLSSRALLDVFAGANALAVEAASGAYEVLQFETATLDPDGAWTLSGLLRGQAGTEAQAAVGASAGARAALITGALARPALSAEQRGQAFTWSAGPDGVAPSEPSFASVTATSAARGFLPLSPVHLRADADGAGGFALSWIRRTRQGGDAWDGEVPVAESVERYQVTVLSGETALRVVETTAPSYAYAAGDVASDFPGGAPAALSFAVRQWSDRVGWGAPATR